MTTRAREPVDWDHLKRRLAESAQRLAHVEVTPEVRDRILRARARVVALEPVPDAPASERLQVVEFLIAYERYAIETTWVREVLALRELTPLPGTPAFVSGIVNVRGRVVSVVDMKAFFDLPDKGLPDLNRVIVIDDGRLEFGLLVDGVVGVHVLQRALIQPPPPTMIGVRQDYLRGLTADGLAVLDAARIAADPRIIVRQERADRHFKSDTVGDNT
jgi:purine-binding chemotaxis protein CheW